MSKKNNRSIYHPKYWPTWLGLGLLWLLALLPMPILALLGYTIGTFFYLVFYSRRKIAFRNLKAAFPDKSNNELRKITWYCFCLIGQALLSIGINWWASAARLERLVNIKGRQYLDEALKNKQNIILLAPHFIGLEIGGYYLNKEIPMLTMYQYSKNKLMDQFVCNRRSRFGGELIERKAPLRNLIKLIRRGLPFYYLPDQDAGRKGVFVPFFSEQASTVPMLGKFTKMTSAVVLPCSTRVLPFGRGYEVEITQPLTDFPSGNDVKDTARMNKEIENMVKKMPEQYFWVHKRFKTRPEGEGKFY